VDIERRDEMQKVVLEWPAYGYRRITREWQERGFRVTHKRVLRMMREDNPLRVRRRAFVVTTDSRHNLPVYPNRAREMAPAAVQPALGGRHHLHSTAYGVRVPGGDLGRFLAACGGLVAGSNARSGTGRYGFAYGADRVATAARSGALLRSLLRPADSPRLPADR
jgi:transposase InsO family protein